MFCLVFLRGTYGLVFAHVPPAEPKTAVLGRGSAGCSIVFPRTTHFVLKVSIPRYFDVWQETRQQRGVDTGTIGHCFYFGCGNICPLGNGWVIKADAERPISILEADDTGVHLPACATTLACYVVSYS